LNAFVNLKLAAVGAPPVTSKSKTQNFLSLVDPILKSYQEQQHLLIEHGGALCPADQRIQSFLNSYLADTGEAVPNIPSRQLKLDRHGLAKLLSLPVGEDIFQNEIITSYRVAQVRHSAMVFKDHDGFVCS
jgi:phosphoenolpyruvate carboxykinase (diphosphate)